MPQLEEPTTKNTQLCTGGLWGEKGKNKILKKKKIACAGPSGLQWRMAKHRARLSHLTATWAWRVLTSLGLNLLICNNWGAHQVSSPKWQENKVGKCLVIRQLALDFPHTVYVCLFFFLLYLPKPPLYTVVYLSRMSFLVVGCGTLPQRGLTSSAMSVPRITNQQNPGPLMRSART